MVAATFIVVALLCTVSICQSTLIWRIDVEPPAYIFGTVHIPITYSWPSLSPTWKLVFNESSHFLPEFDMTNLFSFTRLRGCMNSKLAASFSNRPVSPDAIAQFVTPQTMNNPFLDLHLTIEARRQGKFVASLETVDIYCEFASLQAELPESMPGAIPNLDDAYKRVQQDYDCEYYQPNEFLESIDGLFQGPSMSVFRDRMIDLIRRRDTAMSENIHQYLENRKPTDRFVFAIGSMHLLNRNGMINILRQKFNYTVTRLCTDPIEFRREVRCPIQTWCDRMSNV